MWAPFNMPWSIAFMGYAAGSLAPCRTSFPDFLKAAHTLGLAQGEAHRALKAASAKATVGSAYEMAPAYPKTDSEANRAAADRYHAWTLLDNFQWAEGYTERYGLIYTDFRSQKRTIKDSGLWYSKVAASNRLDV
jgi:beta-glucosidase/6-phospho-beta-glucosidase/beta-galactosidase